MLRVLRITGQSLTPEYQEGDFVMISKIPFFFIPPRKGDTIAFRHPAYGLMIKRINEVEPASGNLFVLGTHPSSVDSREFGAISSGSVLGRVIWHVRRPRSA
ncbi:MAG: hypothetical protein JW726_06425 [Anaerolineales bacterium]|nr:hypothetical protein [Anaerolineales bacterium]